MVAKCGYAQWNTFSVVSTISGDLEDEDFEKFENWPMDWIELGICNMSMNN